MPEDHDYSPAPWSARDTFASARSAYDVHVGRSYDDAKKKSVGHSDLVPKRISTKCEAPIVVYVDVTGSMGEWPATIFSKLGYLDHEAKFYFGSDYKIAFGAIGDCFCDSYPLQIQPFTSGEGLKNALTKLVIEGGGGGGAKESYDLGALYASRNCYTPNALKPLLVFIGDEGLYDEIYPDMAEKYCKVNLKNNMPLKKVFDELLQRFDVYVIRKPYGYDQTPGSADEKIQRQWEGLLGEDHVINLPEASRVVDVLFGIFAKVTNRVEDFEKELKDRQLKDKDGKHKVEVVMKSLMSIHGDGDEADAKALPTDDLSVTKAKKTKGSKSKSLLK